MVVLLSTVVMLSSGGLLADHPPPTGALIGAFDTSTAPVESLSLAELRREQTRLGGERRSLGLPIGLLIGGGISSLIGLAVAAVAYEVGGFIAGIIVATLGVAAVVVGIILLIPAIASRHDGARMKAVERRIRDIESGRVIEPPSNDEAVPTAMWPPSSERFPTEPSVLLATF